MNACCVHLLEFLKAKSKLAEQRRRNSDPAFRLSQEEEEEFEQKFFSYLSSGKIHLKEELRIPLRNLCGANFTPDDANFLRESFHQIGCSVLGLNVPLVFNSGIKTKKTIKFERENPHEESSN